jgi:hypothetical protein
MSQFDFQYTNFGQGNTTTGVLIKSGPGVLHSVTVGSSGTAGNQYILYDSTACSTGAIMAVVSVQSPSTPTYLYDIVFRNGLLRGQTTSTAEVTIAWS